MRRPTFGRPSASPDFLKAQETLEPDEQKLLGTLTGSPQNESDPATTTAKQRERIREDRTHRTTIWLPVEVQRQIRIRALERGQTISAYVLELLARDGLEVPAGSDNADT